jgi:release factor glutamine methyltransferase
VATTIREAIGIGAATLGAAGIPEPRRDAWRLWSDLDRSAATAVLLRQDDPATDLELERFLVAVGRRANGEPAAHVTGIIGFRRLVLRSDRRALIPRPETEGLVAVALERVRVGVAADIGTGSGAIALALRDEGAFSEVIGVELSPDALSLASENVAATGLAVTLLAGDLVEPLAGRAVDLLVANLPYLTTAEHDTLDRSVRDYEPAMALVSGSDGLALTRRLLDQGRTVMAAGGWIALEVDSRRAPEVAGLATGHGWQDVTVQEDLFGRARFVLARRGNQ